MYLTLHQTKRDPSALQIHICRTVVKKCTSKSSLRYLCYNPIKSTETCSFLFIILNSKCISYSALFWNRRRDNCSSVHMMMIPIEAIFVLQFKLANFQTLCIKEFLKMFIQLIFTAVEKCIRKNVRLGNWLVLREIQCFQTHFCFCGKSERPLKYDKLFLLKTKEAHNVWKSLPKKVSFRIFTPIIMRVLKVIFKHCEKIKKKKYWTNKDSS